MKYLIFLIFTILLIGCTKDDEAIPEVDIDHLESILGLHDKLARKPQGDCSKDDWKKAKTREERYDYPTFYVIYHKIDGGANNGNWHNPVEGYGRVVYDYNDNVLAVASYNNQINEDVVQKVGKGQNAVYVRYEAGATFYNGVAKYKHKRDAKYHDVDGIPARYHIDMATGDTLCVGNWECDRLISGDECSL